MTLGGAGPDPALPSPSVPPSVPVSLQGGLSLENTHTSEQVQVLPEVPKEPAPPALPRPLLPLSPSAHSAPATGASSLFLLPQGLCTGCPLCLECFSHDILARRTPLHPSRTQLKCHLLKEAPLTSPVTSSPLPTLTPSV